MTQERKDKILFWVFKVISLLFSCIPPVWAVCERFPMWTEEHGTGRSVGIGLILAVIVCAIVFRKMIASFVTEKLHLTQAPPLAIWVILLVASYCLLLFAAFLQDLIIVLWMGLIGCALGTIINFVGTEFFLNKEEK